MKEELGEGFVEGYYKKSYDLQSRAGFYNEIAKIDASALEIPPIFDLIEKTGKISRRDMFNTFNMGSGMVLIVKADEANQAVAALKAQGVTVTLAVVQVGNDPASSVYVNNKKKEERK